MRQPQFEAFGPGGQVINLEALAPIGWQGCDKRAVADDIQRRQSVARAVKSDGDL